MSDLGNLEIKITGIDRDGHPTGERKDGARVAIKSADAQNRVQRVKNVTPTLLHKLYFFEALNDEADRRMADRRIAAAERLQLDFYEAGLDDKMGAAFGIGAGGDRDETEKQSHHKKQWNEAVDACGSRYKNDVIMAVNWDTQPSALDSLLRGLDLLIKHYGMD
jgi:hypothetical protein